MTTVARLCTILLLSITTSALHAQNILGKTMPDAIVKLGTEYDKTVDGPITKLKYTPRTIDHPIFGSFRETDQYDFINGRCEARHAYIPLSLKQKFIDDCNEQFGRGDHLWRGENNTYIAIKEHADNFELMVWTPVYEAVLDR